MLSLPPSCNWYASSLASVTTAKGLTDADGKPVSDLLCWYCARSSITVYDPVRLHSFGSILNERGPSAWYNAVKVVGPLTDEQPRFIVVAGDKLGGVTAAVATLKHGALVVGEQARVAIFKGSGGNAKNGGVRELVVSEWDEPRGSYRANDPRWSDGSIAAPPSNGQLLLTIACGDAQGNLAFLELRVTLCVEVEQHTTSEAGVRAVLAHLHVVTLWMGKPLAGSTAGVTALAFASVARKRRASATGKAVRQCLVGLASGKLLLVELGLEESNNPSHTNTAAAGEASNDRDESSSASRLTYVASTVCSTVVAVGRQQSDITSILVVPSETHSINNNTQSCCERIVCFTREGLLIELEPVESADDESLTVAFQQIGVRSVLGTSGSTPTTTSVSKDATATQPGSERGGRDRRRGAKAAATAQWSTGALVSVPGGPMYLLYSYAGVGGGGSNMQSDSGGGFVFYARLAVGGEHRSILPPAPQGDVVGGTFGKLVASKQTRAVFSLLPLVLPSQAGGSSFSLSLVSISMDRTIATYTCDDITPVFQGVYNDATDGCDSNALRGALKCVQRAPTVFATPMPHAVSAHDELIVPIDKMLLCLAQPFRSVEVGGAAPAEALQFAVQYKGFTEGITVCDFHAEDVGLLAYGQIDGTVGIYAHGSMRPFGSDGNRHAVVAKSHHGTVDSVVWLSPPTPKEGASATTTPGNRASRLLLSLGRDGEIIIHRVAFGAAGRQHGGNRGGTSTPTSDSAVLVGSIDGNSSNRNTRLVALSPCRASNAPSLHYWVCVVTPRVNHGGTKSNDVAMYSLAVNTASLGGNKKQGGNNEWCTFHPSATLEVEDGRLGAAVVWLGAAVGYVGEVQPAPVSRKRGREDEVAGAANDIGDAVLLGFSDGSLAITTLSHQDPTLKLETNIPPLQKDVPVTALAVSRVDSGNGLRTCVGYGSGSVYECSVARGSESGSSSWGLTVQRVVHIPLDRGISLLAGVAAVRWSTTRPDAAVVTYSDYHVAVVDFTTAADASSSENESTVARLVQAMQDKAGIVQGKLLAAEKKTRGQKPEVPPVATTTPSNIGSAGPQPPASAGTTGLLPADILGEAFFRAPQTETSGSSCASLLETIRGMSTHPSTPTPSHAELSNQHATAPNSFLVGCLRGQVDVAAASVGTMADVAPATNSSTTDDSLAILLRALTASSMLPVLGWSAWQRSVRDIANSAVASLQHQSQRTPAPELSATQRSLAAVAACLYGASGDPCAGIRLLLQQGMIGEACHMFLGYASRSGALPCGDGQYGADDFLRDAAGSVRQ